MNTAKFAHNDLFGPLTPLESLIREAAHDGRLHRVSIVRDPSGRGWQANVPSRYDNKAWSIRIDPDPITALIGALS